MFSQLFGKYLIENDVINEGQFDDILARYSRHTGRMHVILVNDVLGY